MGGAGGGTSKYFFHSISIHHIVEGNAGKQEESEGGRLQLQEKKSTQTKKAGDGAPSHSNRLFSKTQG